MRAPRILHFISTSKTSPSFQLADDIQLSHSKLPPYILSTLSHFTSVPWVSRALKIFKMKKRCKNAIRVFKLYELSKITLAKPMTNKNMNINIFILWNPCTTRLCKWRQDVASSRDDTISFLGRCLMMKQPVKSPLTFKFPPLYAKLKITTNLH